MEIIQILVGRYIIELTGAGLRTGFNRIASPFSKSTPKKFSDYWNHKKGGTYEKMETETANRIVGGFFFAGIIALIIIFTV